MSTSLPLVNAISSVSAAPPGIVSYGISLISAAYAIL